MGRSAYQRAPRAQPITDRNYKFTFGRHKGSTLDDVLLDDPGYIVWLQSASEQFEVAADLYDEALGENAEPDRYKEEKVWEPVKAPANYVKEADQMPSHLIPYDPDSVDDSCIPF